MPELVYEPIHRSVVSDHLVQVYREVGELAASVTTFLAAGFEAGDPAIVVATAAHWPVIGERLGRAGWSTAELEADGRLLFADADELLAAILEEGRPSLRRFSEGVGDLLDRATAAWPNRRVRVFGEMVDILCRNGETEAADLLEELWNRLGLRRNFSLLCGYKVDVFDRGAQLGLLPQVCRSHSHVLPAVDAERMERAVDAALIEALGVADAHKVYAQVALQVREQRVPVPDLALMWVSAHMPRSAERVLAAARTHYLGDATTA
jgi:hypothetical protein